MKIDGGTRKGNTYIYIKNFIIKHKVMRGEGGTRKDRFNFMKKKN